MNLSLLVFSDSFILLNIILVNLEELYECFNGYSHGITQFIKIIFESNFIVFFKQDNSALLLFSFDIIFFDKLIILSAIALTVLFVLIYISFCKLLFISFSFNRP